MASTSSTTMKRKATEAAATCWAAHGDLEEFDLASCAVPQPGERVLVLSKDNSSEVEVTVHQALGKNGRPLRSKLFEVGALFKPEMTGGLNFLCCVPTRDADGTWKRCGTLLKIPKDSLGNPFRHIRQKHPKAYGVLVGESGRERGTKSARKQIKVDDVIDQATAAVRSGERVGTKRCNGAGRRRENLLQKGVEFCAKNLLPLDVIDSKGFKTFTAFLSRTVKKSDDLEAPSLPEDRNACLEQLSRAVVQRMKQSIAEKRQQYYQGVPFLRIVVEPDFVPYPLVRIVCYDEAGEPHEMNYVTSSEELTNLCLAPAKTAAYAKAVEVTVKDVLGDELASVWENAVSIEVYSSEGLVGQTPYPVIGGRTDKGKVDLETILRYVDPTVIWSADDRPSMEEHLVNLFRSLPSAEVDLETTLKRLAEEFDRYASTRDAMQRGRADWRTPGKLASRVTGYWESAHGEDTPLLRKLALSVRPLGEKEERRPLQSKRDIRTIESGDFLQPGDNFEKKNTQNTLMVKYN